MSDSMARVKAAIAAFQQGQMVVLTDHPERENEGDLIMPAECITDDAMNFMIRQGTGIVCLSMTSERAEALDLPYMVPPTHNTSFRGTPFLISIDAVDGITTGVSASDRVETIKIACSDHAKPSNLARPGHIFPLRAVQDGVLMRQGHTEGAIDLAKLAGFKPMAVLCEIMNQDGTMASGAALDAFCKKHALTYLSIDDLVAYRLRHEDFIEDVARATLPLAEYGTLDVIVMRDRLTKLDHLALYKAPINAEKPALVRVHSSCATGDLFASLRCDCHQALHHALSRIASEGGVLLYMNQEGRGIGLLNKIKAYALQEQGMDTVEANEALGLPADARSYYFAGNMLRHLGLQSIRLMTNNPEKIREIAEVSGIDVTREDMPHFCNQYNETYIQTKRDKMGHFSGPLS